MAEKNNNLEIFNILGKQFLNGLVLASLVNAPIFAYAGLQHLLSYETNRSAVVSDYLRRQPSIDSSVVEEAIGYSKKVTPNKAYETGQWYSAVACGLTAGGLAGLLLIITRPERKKQAQ